MKRVIKFIVPILIIALGVAFVFFNELYLKSKLNTEEVLVVNRDIEFTEKITKDDISVENINRDHVVEGAFRPSQIDLVLDKRASINIAKGTQLYADLIDSYELVPDESKGEFIAPIPETWLFAVAGSMRKGYVADFYVVGGNDSATIERLLRDLERENNSVHNQENKNQENDEQDEGLELDQELVNENEEEITEIIKSLREPILTNVRIASVRDRTNKEIVTTDRETQSSSGSIADLEIIANEDMLNEIRNYIEDGYKLYVVYRFSEVETIEEETEIEGDE